MNATASAKTASTESVKKPVQIGKTEEKGNTKGFANLLADTIQNAQTKGTQKGVGASSLMDLGTAVSTPAQDPKAIKSAANQGAANHAKGVKAPIDLTQLGEIEEDTKKEGPIKLGDLLAELSHESTAPKGSEIINLKTVLGAKNDDPDLINKDLISLVPKKDQPAVTEALINGAKEMLKSQLEARIPNNRVPKTLKGLVEMAVRFNMEVSDVKLENIPESKVSQELLAALDKKKSQMPLPTLGTQVVMEALDEDIKQSAALKNLIKKEGAESTKSPLEKILASQQNKSDAAVQKKSDELVKKSGLESAQEIVKEQGEVAAKEKSPVATATAASTTKMTPSTSKEREKESKIEKSDAKSSAKELASKAELPSQVKSGENVTQSQTQTQGKGSPLEQILAEKEGQEAKGETLSEGKNSVENTHTASAKSDVVQKAETNLGAKMAEARQLVSQLSSDIKEAMENYKPPFTKISMKLNPERLGEIDVVMVQRGNNVHINLSSNSQALGLLQQNSSDLKAALSNAGLGDSTMNFSSNGQDRNPDQQQQRHHSTQEKYAEMAKFADDIDLLEIVVPRYV